MTHIKIVVLALLVGLLSACVGTPSQPTRLYLLSSSSDSKERMTLPEGASVIVGPITLPAYLDRPQIVTHVSPNTLSLSELDQWAEPLAQNLKRVLIQNLSVKLQSNSIFAYPSTIRPGSQMPQLAIDFSDIRFTANGETIVDVRWSLYNSLGDTPLFREGGTFRHTIDASFEGKAKALSTILDQIASQLATLIHKTVLAS